MPEDEPIETDFGKLSLRKPYPFLKLAFVVLTADGRLLTAQIDRRRPSADGGQQRK